MSVRIALAMIFLAAFLFGFDAWSTWFMDGHPEVRAFFSSPGFTAALIIGGVIAMASCAVAVSALILYADGDRP